MKKSFVVLMVLILSVSAVFSNGNAEKVPTSVSTADFGKKDPASYSGTITLMAHSNQLQSCIDRFMKVYPNVKVELNLVPGSEQLQAVLNAIDSGKNVPDLFTARTQFIKYITNIPGGWANLSEAPFRGEEIAKNIIPYVIDLSRDNKGNLRSISWQSTVGGIYYRRSLAKKYFGTDDPAEISKLFSTWETFMDSARKLKAKSNGTIGMVASYSRVKYAIEPISDIGFVKDGKLYIDEDMFRLYFDTAKTLYDEGLTVNAKEDAQYIATMANGNVFAYVAPTWAINFQIMPNAPATSGDWALAYAPSPYFAGGTFLGIAEQSKNKELAWLLFEYIVGNEENLEAYATESGDYVSYMPVTKKLGALPAAEASKVKAIQFMGGQNLFDFYNGLVAKGVNSKIVTEYDEMLTKFLDLACTEYVEHGKSFKEAVEYFKQEAFTYAPELK
jgi:ABC-type glycerol-3-phosphate transport system substrate-binding protein